MDKHDKDRCKVSVYLSPDQKELSEERIYEGFKSISLQKPVVGTELMRAVREKLGGDSNNEGSVQYTIALTDLVPPSPRLSRWPRYWGSVYFVDKVCVPPHIYAEDLMRIIFTALDIEKSVHKMHGFDPLPKRGAQVSNELVNQIREEMGF